MFEMTETVDFFRNYNKKLPRASFSASQSLQKVSTVHIEHVHVNTGVSVVGRYWLIILTNCFIGWA